MEHEPPAARRPAAGTLRGAIVTGAGSGIGRACALALGEAGYGVAVGDLDAAAAAATVRLLEERGSDGVAVVLDVGRRDECRRLAGVALERWGRVDALVANAGVQLSAPLERTTDEDWDRVLATNLKGAAFCAEAVMPAMLERRSGAIVFVSSVNAVVGSAEMPVYDASKAALVGLTKSLAVRLGEDGIRVNAVAPGATITEFHLRRAANAGMTEEELRARAGGYGVLGRPAEPAEIAAAIRFLAGDEGSFVTGQLLLVDGGAALRGAPG
ncbi:MAG: SDR family oxidoreductase [Gaiella sp.]|nr:SDR family oxidoreductase [Gaiella sp.]